MRRIAAICLLRPIAVSRSGGLLPDPPISPGKIPVVAICEPLRHRIDAMCTAWPTAHHAEQAHPSPGPQAVARYRLVGIFRAGRQMPAGIADEARQRQLVEPDKRCACDAARRLAPWAGPVAPLPRTARGFHMMVVAHRPLPGFSLRVSLWPIDVVSKANSQWRPVAHDASIRRDCDDAGIIRPA